MKSSIRRSLCVLLTCLCIVDARSQEAEQLPSPAPSEQPSGSDVNSIEPPSLVPEPVWEQATPPLGLQLGPPPVIESVLPKIDPESLKQNALLLMGNTFVKRFQFTGNRAFSSSTLEKVVQKYTGRKITAEELEQARQDLTLYYVNRGYINSGAIIPGQDFGNEIITIRIVEGRLSGIKLTGNFWFRPWWIRNEIRRAAGPPLNFNKLKEGLQLLRQNPLIFRVNAELKPGGVPGESSLDLDIKDTQPFRFSLEFSNKRPPSDGAEILEAQFADLNLTGHNDPLQIHYGIAHTTRDNGFDFSGLDNIEGTYAFPITAWATTLEVHASKSDTSIIEEPFTTLDINSKLEEYGATIRQPVYQTLSNDVAVSLTADKRRAETFLLGQPFSLSPGAVNGVTSVSVLRFTQEWVNRSQLHVLALRSTFSLGLDAFGATNSGSEPDARFFSWLGQSQYVRRLWNTDNLLILRLNAQLSESPLFSLEQLSLGGAQSVRGYRENSILRDNAVFASLEVRLPVLRGKEHKPILILAPFVDVGAGWNTLDNSTAGNLGGATSQSRNTETLPSAGLGLIFDPERHVHAELYWGYAFNRALVTEHNNLQDYGFHFVVTVNAF